ncbi:hypothetical protein JVX91_03035 [Pseudomonas sp. PDNC002]|uniref:hypothetical protein n=1 Tax=Pseudomonas sp. PDNC002 TaxID=2811422 RepID=UPI001963E2E1|nr:hypothetical protein [Pseudomonas sp. PDNC002]QRY80112.1 hypothetical protein JVX91_03035 [Pseudomonas sp. PDNC002]
MGSFEDRSKSILKKITEAAKEASDGGVRESYGVAGVGILAGQLIMSLERIERLESEIRQLSEKAATLEERGLKYCGTWQRAMDYRRGDCVTHKGSLWTAVKATDKAPDEAAPDWQLSAKGAQR